MNCERNAAWRHWKMAWGFPETQQETLEQLSRRSNYFFVYFFQNFQVVSGNYGNYPGSAPAVVIFRVTAGVMAGLCRKRLVFESDDGSEYELLCSTTTKAMLALTITIQSYPAIRKSHGSWKIVRNSGVSKYPSLQHQVTVRQRRISLTSK